MNKDDLYPGEDPVEGFHYGMNLDACRGCSKGLLPENRIMADGCPCNSGRGVNHGLVAKNTCTCIECDPAQTGSSRVKEPWPTLHKEFDYGQTSKG